MTKWLSPADVERWLGDMAKPSDYQGYCCEGHFDRQHALEQFVRALAARNMDIFTADEMPTDVLIKAIAVARLLVKVMEGGGK